MIGGNERARDRESVDSDQQKTSEPANAGDQQVRQRLACCPPARAGADGGQQPDWRSDDDDRHQRTEMGEAPPPSLGMLIMPATNLLPAQAVVLKVWFAPPPS